MDDLYRSVKAAFKKKILPKIEGGLRSPPTISASFQKDVCCYLVKLMDLTNFSAWLATTDEFYLTSSVECAQLTPGHMYLIAHTMVRVFAVLPLLVLVCGTICRFSFETRTFRSTVLKLY